MTWAVLWYIASCCLILFFANRRTITVPDCPCCDTGGAPCTCPCADGDWDDLESGTTCPCNGLYRKYTVTFDLEVEKYDTTGCTGSITKSCGPSSFEVEVEAVADADCVWGVGSITSGSCSGFTLIDYSVSLDTNACLWSVDIQVIDPVNPVDAGFASATLDESTPEGDYTSNGWECNDKMKARITNVTVTKVSC